MNVIAGIYLRIRRCPLATTLVLVTVVFYGIAFFFALDQSTVMAGILAKPGIMLLIGFPTFTAVMALIAGSRCSLNRDGRV